MNKEELYRQVVATQVDDNEKPMTKKKFNEAIKELQAKGFIMVEDESPPTKEENATG